MELNLSTHFLPGLLSPLFCKVTLVAPRGGFGLRFSALDRRKSACRCWLTFTCPISYLKRPSLSLLVLKARLEAHQAAAGNLVISFAVQMLELVRNRLELKALLWNGIFAITDTGTVTVTAVSIWRMIALRRYHGVRTTTHNACESLPREWRSIIMSRDCA